jgi:hypothetical protein
MKHESGEWTELARDMVQWQGFVNMVMKRQGFLMGNFLHS